MITVSTQVYKFTELSKEAQDKVMIDFIHDVLFQEQWEENSPYYPAMVEMERMHTPWFLGETLFHDYREELISDIEANDWDYYSDGTFFVKK